jgi:hypothetical protein
LANPDGVTEFLQTVRDRGLVTGHFRALLHVVVGRTISLIDGTVISNGLSWRDLSVLLKELRFDKDLVEEIGQKPDDLPPRDRQRYWYSAILAAKIDHATTRELGDHYARLLLPLGYVVGP